MIKLKGNPISTQTAYLQHWKMRFMTKKAKEMKQSYINQLKEYDIKKSELDVRLSVSFYFWDNRKRDIDNFNKLWMDACTWFLYDDDVQIKALHLYKFIDIKEPRIEINILDND